MSDDMLDGRDRLPPHSLEAEQSILGAIMLDNTVLDRINGKLHAEDFYNGAHRRIFEHGQTLHSNGQPVDVITLNLSLEAAGKLDYVGGLAYLGTLLQNVPTAANAEHYAGIVRQRADCRRVAALALEVHEAVTNQRGIGTDEVNERLASLLRDAWALNRPLWSLPPLITANEFSNARLTPACIVENYLFADVAVLVAPGGMGKTTLLLWECIHIVLGIALYGNTIGSPGPVLVVTAEDTREMLVARLRMMIEAMLLGQEQVAVVLRDVRISDVCGEAFKLTRIVGDVVMPSPIVDVVIEECRSLRPVMVVLDPAISFGVGESRVNDAEQALVEAARRIRNAIGCCVRYIHHSGKANAREKTVDQYSGRGGSAFADGCRMVAVLQPLTPEEWVKATGNSLMDGEQGMVLARPKLSYCPPAEDILLTRKGYAFAFTGRPEPDPGADLAANCAQIMQALDHDLGRGVQHTKNSLEALRLMPRPDLRDALSTLIARGRVLTVKCTKKGGPQYYLQPQASPIQPSEP